MPNLVVNGTAVTAREGATLLDALASCGVRVPALCHDPRLKPIGSCRLCVVEVENRAHPLAACSTAAEEGMRVRTHTPELEKFRATILGWMAGKTSTGAVQRDPDKELHRALGEYGLAPGAPDTPDALCDLSHPYIQVDMSHCITCFRCVRICEDVQGQFVWHAFSRSDETVIVPDSGSTLGTSSCVGCGACVDTCPTGALTDRKDVRAAEAWTRTVCGYCGVGCELNVGHTQERITAIRPVLDAPVSKGHLCVKGRYAFEFAQASDRQTSPLLRDGTTWRKARWDDALAFTAKEFARIKARYGPDALGVLGSARATNEENYLAQKFARLVLGTHNVDCCARVCHTPSAAALKSMLGTGAGTNSFDDIERAAAFLIVGANVTENHPVAGARIRQHVLQGAPLIVIDPRRTELADRATLHLASRPGTNIPVLNAMAHVIVNEGLADMAFVRARVAEWGEFKSFIAAWTPERAAGICGVPANSIRQAARLYATRKPAMSFHGLGLTEHVQGTEGVMALVNLALLTGNLGRAGGGINPLRGQNNVQGAAHMGCDPGILTGSVAIGERRALFETVWGMPLPRERGLNLMNMMDAAASGRLKALWIIGYDVYLTLANAAATRAALEKLEFIVVQDLFLNETAKSFAKVFLPAASVFEKDGTFMNSERRIQRVRKAVPPPGEARADWRIICDVAARMGQAEAFSYSSAEEIWNEVRRVWPEGAGITYERLDREGGLQWPCLDERDPGTPVLYADGFVRSSTAALRRIEYVPSPEAANSEFPLLLTTGRSLYQFNVGTMTMRTDNIKLRATDTLDISAADALRFGVAAGGRVRVRSRYGEVELYARLSGETASGQVFATFHDPAVFLNRLTGPYRDTIVETPEYKITAVRVEPIEAGNREHA